MRKHGVRGSKATKQKQCQYSNVPNPCIRKALSSELAEAPGLARLLKVVSRFSEFRVLSLRVTWCDKKVHGIERCERTSQMPLQRKRTRKNEETT